MLPKKPNLLLLTFVTIVQNVQLVTLTLTVTVPNVQSQDVLNVLKRISVKPVKTVISLTPPKTSVNHNVATIVILVVKMVVKNVNQVRL